MRKFVVSTALLIVFLTIANSQNLSKPAPFKTNGKIFSIPFLKDIVIDGNSKDWKNQGFLVKLFADNTGKVAANDDFSASLKLGWDNQGLLMSLEVTDNKLLVPSKQPFSGDCLELFVANKRGGNDLIQIIMAPSDSGTIKGVKRVDWDFRGSRTVAGLPIKIETVSVRTKNGYHLEALIPMSNLNIIPKNGEEIGFQIYVNDADDLNQPSQRRYQWHYLNDTYKSSWAMQRILFSNKADAPVDYSITSYIIDEDTAFVKVLTEKSSLGKRIALKDSTTQIISAVLTEKNNFGVAELKLPLNRIPFINKPKTLSIDSYSLAEMDFSIDNLKYAEKQGYPFEDDIRVLEMMDRLINVPQNPILFIGHSHIRYWRTLQDDMKGLTVINRGFGGSCSDQVNYYFDRIVKPYKPSIIVYFEGNNDIRGRQRSVSFIANETKFFVNRVHALWPTTKILLLESGIDSLDVEIKKIRTENQSFVESLYAFSALFDSDGREKANVHQPDNVHLSPYGYTLVAPVIKQKLIEMLDDRNK
jgi:lysophospholipase L1-like esterase